MNRIFTCLCAAVISVLSVSAADRPNIMVIVTDDQSPFTLSCYGNTICETPNLDEFASAGMVLDQAYHMGSMSGAVCSPSRTMIMSGRTLWHLPPRGKKNRKKGTGQDERCEYSKQHHARSVQPRWIRYVSNVQKRKQLFTCQSAVHDRAG